jgi:hypothetical protein
MVVVYKLPVKQKTGKVFPPLMFPLLRCSHLVVFLVLVAIKNRFHNG